MVKKFLQNDFLKHNLVFFLGTLSFSFFNYLYYPVISRLLSVANFGEVQSLITLYMEFGVIFTSFGYLIINIQNNHSSDDEKGLILTELERIALFISLIVGITIILLSPLLAINLKYSGTAGIISLAPLFVITVPYIFRLYYLQSKLHLSKVSIGNIIYSIGKLILASILILLGIQVTGAIWGYTLSLVITWAYLYSNTKKEVPFSKFNLPIILRGKQFLSEKKIISQQAKLGLFIISVLFGLTVLYTADVLVVRKYFSSEIAGFYSGISTIARIIYFLTASVPGVLLASVSTKNSPSQNRKLLYRSIAILVSLGLIGLAGFALFPKLIIGILMGAKFQTFYYLLVPLGLVMLVSSIVNLIFTYHLSVRKYWALFPVLLSLLVFYILVILNHGQLFDIIIDLLIANCVALVGGIYLIWRK